MSVSSEESLRKLSIDSLMTLVATVGKSSIGSFCAMVEIVGEVCGWVGREISILDKDAERRRISSSMAMSLACIPSAY